MIEELSQAIWEKEAFQKDYRRLIDADLASNIYSEQKLEFPDEEQLRKLMQSAVHLASSEPLNFKEAAYRIAICLWRLWRKEDQRILDATRLVFTRLGNFPAVRHLYQEVVENGATKFPASFTPLRLLFEEEMHYASNSKRINGHLNITFTDFQARVWRALEEAKTIVVTAPTSSGKSFALQNYLTSEFCDSKPRLSVYVVPTRALITQVSESISEICEAMDLGNVLVTTIPSTAEELETKRIFYVLTQERLQMLLDKSPDLSFSTLVVDEAQLLGESSRGIILQSVIERVRHNNPLLNVFFGSPNSANPDVFPKLFNFEKAAILQTSESPVAQNLVFLKTDAHDATRVDISVQIQGERRYLTHAHVAGSLQGATRTLGQLAVTFGRTEQNLIYASGPAACEDTAEMIVNILGESEKRVIPQRTIDERAAFASFLKDYFHEDYYLATAIEAGVAFHYGNMPSTIRKEIERLFSSGCIEFLVCTSTLLHGVNLPAKNLFLFNPTKGTGRL